MSEELKNTTPMPVAYRHWCECDTDENDQPIFGWEYFENASCAECQPLYTTAPTSLIGELIAEIDSIECEYLDDYEIEVKTIIKKYRSIK